MDDFNERKTIESHRPYEVARFTLRHLYNISGRFEKWLTEDSEVEIFSWDKKKTSQTQHIQTQKPQQTAAEIQEMIFKILKPKPKV